MERNNLASHSLRDGERTITSPTASTSSSEAASAASQHGTNSSEGVAACSSVKNKLVSGWQSELIRQTRSVQRLAAITHGELLTHIKVLNEISRRYLDDNGKRLIFAVKKGTDDSILWKATVRICCSKVDAESKAVDSLRTVSLNEFLTVFHRLKNQADADVANWAEFQHSFAEKKILTSSSPEVECIICLERKPELILPCAHSYCTPCIEQWNVNHKTCPVCREKLDTTDEGWVVPDQPDGDQIATEIQKTLLSLTP